VLLPVGSNALLEVALVIALSRIAAVQVAVVLALGSVVLLMLASLRQQRWPMPLALLGAGLVVVAAGWSMPAGQGSEAMAHMSPMGETLVANTATGNSLLLLVLLALSTVTLVSSEPVARDLGAVNYGIWQCLLQTLIFLVWAITTYGFSHLYDLQSPLLWQMMLLYGAGISTLYTLCENLALARSGPLLVSLFEGLLPLFSGVFALGLLGEAFSTNLLISSLVTAIGIVCVELG
jgi:drug/metabolite transporter (DMT)-like permease